MRDAMAKDLGREGANVPITASWGHVSVSNR